MVVKTVASLRKSCKKLGITGCSGLKKAQLMRKIGSPKKKSAKKSSATSYGSLRRRSGSRRSGSRSRRSGSRRTVWVNGWPYTPLPRR